MAGFNRCQPDCQPSNLCSSCVRPPSQAASRPPRPTPHRAGLSAAQHAALLNVDAAALQTLAFDITELSEPQLVPYIVSMFMDLNLAYVK